MVVFYEAVKGLKKTDNANRWLVRLMSEGQGTSGFYPAETIRDYLPSALPVGTHVYLNHSTEEDFKRGGERDVTKLAGVVRTEPVYDESEKAAYAEVEFSNGLNPMIEQFHNDIGLSIEIYKGAKNAEGIVTELGFDQFNSVAIVPRAGRDGKIAAKLSESFRIAEEALADANAEHNKNRNDMEEKQVKDLIAAALAESLKPINDTLEKFVKESQEAEPKREINYLNITESILDAKLPKSATARVFAAVESGQTVEDAIKAEKDMVAEIKESLKSERSDDQGFSLVYESDRSENYDDKFQEMWK